MGSSSGTPIEILAATFTVPMDDVEACRDRLRAISRGRNQLDDLEAGVVRRLEELRSFPAAVLAEEQRTSLSAGQRLSDRAATADAIPELGLAMGDGVLSGRKVDIVASQLRGLNADQHEQVAANADRIIRAGATLSDREFDSAVRRIVDQVRDDQLERFEQQRRQTRFGLRQQHGMTVPFGQFDPERGAILTGALTAEVERLFHGGVPDDAPTDHVERQQYLSALALLSLVTGGQGSGDGVVPGPDVSVRVDVQTLLDGPHDASVLEVSAGGNLFDLPVEVIRSWLDNADITPIAVAPGGQQLMMGRTRRTATRAQRRALRNLYAGCAMCETAFDHCHIHHVDWWEHGGHTDIDNLLPVCNRHHKLIHYDGWQLHLAPDRTLTITLPDGTVRVHAPPRARAA